MENIKNLYKDLDLYQSINIENILSENDSFGSEILPKSFGGTPIITGGSVSYRIPKYKKILKHIRIPHELKIREHCIKCSCDSIFNSGDWNENNDLDIFTVFFRCTDCNHFLTYTFREEGEFITKIGQYPSKKDLLGRSTIKYEKLLGKEYAKEMVSSLILQSHGFGIGAYIHLRRIFEKVILDTFQEYKSELGIDDKTFLSKKIEEKIKILKKYLPDFLVRNKKIYVIVSDHIHNLTEEHCKENFAVIYSSIELMLDKKINKKEEELKETELEKSLNSM